MRFDHFKFLRDNFQTPSGLTSLLAAYNVEHPPADTVRKWFSRGVPTEWFAQLLCVLELENGRAISLCQYLEGRR